MVAMLDAAWPNEEKPGGIASGRVARILGFGFAAFAILWLMQVGPLATDVTSVNLGLVAAQLQQGDAYSESILADFETTAATILSRRICTPADLENLSILGAARVDAAFVANDPDAAALAVQDDAVAASRSLWCNPYSSQSWTILAWLEFLKNGGSPRFFQLLDLGYVTGPYEGWSLLRRVDLLLRLFPNIGPLELERLRTQMRGMMQTRAYMALATYYVGGNPELKKFLVEVFSTGDERDQQMIGRAVRMQHGDIDLPLMEPRGQRPWSG